LLKLSISLILNLADRSNLNRHCEGFPQYFCRFINSKVENMFLKTTPNAQGLTRPPLSQRESQVLYLVATGLSCKEISEKLAISSNTIRAHRRNIYSKLNVTKTAGAVRKGFEFGYLSFG